MIEGRQEAQREMEQRAAQMGASLWIWVMSWIFGIAKTLKVDYGGWWLTK